MPNSGIESRRQAAIEEGGTAYIARRQEILRTAAHIFREKGYEATLRDVAEALSTDRASIYYYFGSKEEVLQEIVREALAHDMAAARAIQRSNDSTPDKIRALIYSMVVGFAEFYPHMNVHVEDLGRIARQDSAWAVEIIEETRQYEALVRAILRQGQEEGALRGDISINVAAMSLFGMINWMYRWYRPTYPVAPEEIAASFAELFLAGIVPPASAA
ncbi:TetR/AcrR family transcriptional regulator [Sporichthya brevicatena]|uniref:TetR/AcrR family transcriptional regulator n=1 Tax=Sporichthya brevicatena TaxID=171442 RepID=A0ABN1GHS4_9ACTN